MRKRGIVCCFILSAIVVWGCGVSTTINSYLLPESMLIGDNAKGVPPIEKICIWPFVDESGGKGKGLDTKLTEILIDRFYLDGFPKEIIMVDSIRKDNVLKKIQSDLKLKKAPKTLETSLEVTGVGSVVEAQAILVGTITYYDESKIGGEESSYVGIRFALLDARESAYLSIGALVPPKHLWRCDSKRIELDSVFQVKSDLDETVRSLVRDLVLTLERDLEYEIERVQDEIAKKTKESRSIARTYFEQQQYEESIAEWNKILELDPKDQEAVEMVTNINEILAKIEQERLEGEQKKKIEELHAAGMAFYSEQRYEEAVAEWRKLLEIDPENEEALKMIEASEENLRKVEEQKLEGEKESLDYEAEKYFSDENYEEAIAEWKKILELDSTDERAVEMIKTTEERLKNLEGKRLEEEKAKKIEEHHLNAADYFELQEYEKAITEWKKVLELNPDDQEAIEMIKSSERLVETEEEFEEEIEE